MKHYLFVINGNTYLSAGQNSVAALADLSADFGDVMEPPAEIIEVPEHHLNMAYDDASFYYSCLAEYDLIH